LYPTPFQTTSSNKKVVENTNSRLGKIYRA